MIAQRLVHATTSTVAPLTTSTSAPASTSTAVPASGGGKGKRRIRVDAPPVDFQKLHFPPKVISGGADSPSMQQQQGGCERTP